MARLLISICQPCDFAAIMLLWQCSHAINSITQHLALLSVHSIQIPGTRTETFHNFTGHFQAKARTVP